MAGVIGGTVAVAVGMGSMVAGGAATLFAMVNIGALAIAVILAALLLLVPHRAEKWLALAAAVALVATACGGVEIDGIRRWVSVAGFIRLQPAFIFLPLILCAYALRSRDPTHGVAVMLAAAAMALMPDRSMTVPVCAVTLAVWVMDRSYMSAAVLGCALAAGALAWWQADPLPGVRFVEQVIADGWQAGWVNGALLSAGALAMLAPLAVLPKAARPQRRAIIAFAAVWASLLLASLIGMYPTPLLGFGASAIIGYFWSIIALRPPGAPTKDSF